MFCTVIFLVDFKNDGYVSKTCYSQRQGQRKNHGCVESFPYNLQIKSNAYACHASSEKPRRPNTTEVSLSGYHSVFEWNRDSQEPL